MRAFLSYPQGRICEVSEERDPTEDEIRHVLAAMRAAGEPDVAFVDWSSFHHWYGPADEVPGLLRASSSRDPRTAHDALRRLSSLVVDSLCTSPAAALAVPFLVRIAADPDAHPRADALMLAARAGRRVNFAVETRATLFRVGYAPDEIMYGASGDRTDLCAEAARAALGTDAAIVAGLIADEDPDVRIAAAFALATALPLPPDAPGALRARLAVEPDPAVRASLVLALVQLSDDAGEAERWWRDPARPDEVRFAAAVAWLCTTDLPASAELRDLLAEHTTPEMEQVMLKAPWSSHFFDNGLAGWLAGLLTSSAG